MSSMFLAITALEEFWDTSHDILFLGDWCVRSKKDEKILNHPNLEEARSYQSYKFTVKLYETLLPAFSEWLNQIHDVKYSLRYWRIVIGPFLLWYIQVFYHHQFYLKIAYDLYPGLNTIGLSESSYFTPINTLEFTQLAANNDAWNLQLFTYIIKKEFNHGILTKDYSWEIELKKRKEQFYNVNFYKKTTQIKINLLKLLTKFKENELIGLCGCEHEFRKINLYKLIVTSSLKILPLIKIPFPESAAKEQINLNIPLRNTIKKITSDAFGDKVLESLIFNFPVNFVETYKEEEKLSEKSFPYKPKTIIGGISNDRQKIWTAKSSELGAQIINMQHGGGYGAWKYSAYELLEKTNSDAFISWGWRETPGVYPFPSILMCERSYERKIKLKKIKRNKLILWAITSFDPYPAFMASNLLINKKQNYIRWQEQFVGLLQPEIFSELIVRTRPGYNEYDHLKKIIPELKIHEAQTRTSFFDQLCETKILISDNLNSTFHYGLVFNIPTILFWDKELWSINDSAKSIFKKLHEVGIYHDSPESAANFLNQISINPLIWWNKEEVQLAKNLFCNTYALVSKNWIKEWKDRLFAITKDNKGKEKCSKDYLAY